MGRNAFSHGFTLGSGGVTKISLLAATNTLLIAANTRRKALFLQASKANTQRVYVQFGKDAADADGIELEPGVTVFFDDHVPDDIVNGISSAAAVVMVFERG